MIDNSINLSPVPVSKERFGRPGVKFSDVIHQDNSSRDNLHVSLYRETAGDKDTMRLFTEEEGIVNLGNFLHQVRSVAEQSNDEEMANRIENFNKNAIFIGQKELDEGITAIAHHIQQEVIAGDNIYFHIPNDRSSRYITLLIFEEIDKMAAERRINPDKVRMSFGYSVIGDRCVADFGKCKVFVADDFINSGSRIEGATSGMFGQLIASGIGEQRAAEIVEAVVVAAPKPIETEDRIYEMRADVPPNQTPTQHHVAPLAIWSYYSAPRYSGENYKGIYGIIGTSCSCDYGFETEMENYARYYEEKCGEKIELPLFHHISRPYEMAYDDDNKSHYADKNLEDRWINMAQKYIIK